jgi:Flp pilus assembly protein TadB
MSHKSEAEQIREIEEKQRATNWPEALQAGRSVDEFLWKGDPKAKPIQRAGLAVFATMFLSLFAVSVVVVIAKHDWTVTLVALIPGTLSGIAGFRLLRNTFRHDRHTRNQR